MSKSAILHEFVNFVDSQINNNKDPSIPTNFFSNLIKECNENDIVEGLKEFCFINNDAWVADNAMNLKMCVDTKLRIASRVVDLNSIFEFLCAKSQTKFWIYVCVIIDRDIRAIETERQKNLGCAIQDFANDLKNININFEPNDLVLFVQNNVSAIKIRLLNKLNPVLPIDTANEDAFWKHMEIIHNILNPYNHIHFSQDGIGQIFSTLTKQLPTDGSQIDFGQLIGQIASPEMLGNLTKLVQTGNISSVLQSVQNYIPDDI